MTKRRFIACVLPCALLLAAVHAQAQEPQDSKRATEDRRIGLTLAYPGSGLSSGSIGVIWQTSNRLALRPEFFVSARFAADSANGGASDSWSFGATLTVLCYVGRKEGVSAYVGPRVSYSRASSGGGGTDTTNASYGAGVNAGLQYALTKRISVYGEAGLGYLFARYTYTGTSFEQKDASHGISSRSSLGLNLFF